MAKIAFIGDSKKSDMIFNVLRLLGGHDSGYTVTDSKYFYYINEYLSITGTTHLNSNSQWCKYTIDEFNARYPFTVGDTVIDRNSGKEYVIREMFWNGYEIRYYMKNLDNRISFTTEELKYNNLTGETSKCENIKIPSGYKFVKIIKNDNGQDEIVIEKIQKYPKTIKECIKCINAEFKLDSNSYETKLFANFYRLIICRDAYWKIAGEEMGLSEPWKPEWNTAKFKNVITYIKDSIRCTKSVEINRILAFPTEKMRDEFYENFKDLIEQCKEFL